MQTKQTGPAITAASSTGPRLEAGLPGVGPGGKQIRQFHHFLLCNIMKYIQFIYLMIFELHFLRTILHKVTAHTHTKLQWTKVTILKNTQSWKGSTRIFKPNSRLLHMTTQNSNTTCESIIQTLCELLHALCQDYCAVSEPVPVSDHLANPVYT